MKRERSKYANSNSILLKYQSKHPLRQLHYVGVEWVLISKVVIQYPLAFGRACRWSPMTGRPYIHKICTLCCVRGLSSPAP